MEIWSIESTERLDKGKAGRDVGEISLTLPVWGAACIQTWRWWRAQRTWGTGTEQWPPVYRVGSKRKPGHKVCLNHNKVYAFSLMLCFEWKLHDCVLLHKLTVRRPLYLGDNTLVPLASFMTMYWSIFFTGPWLPRKPGCVYFDLVSISERGTNQ